MVGFLPGILGASQHEHQIEGSKPGDRFALPQPHRLRDDAVLGEIIEKAARVVVVHVLEDQGARHVTP